MGQYEILTFLKKERDKGNDKFFTIQEVRDAMKKIGANDEAVGGTLLNCERYKLVEGKYNMNVYAWTRMFRMNDSTYKRFCEMEEVQTHGRF